MTKQTVTLFKNSKSKLPDSILDVKTFLFNIQNGHWKREVDRLRDADKKHYKALKGKLPAVTVSGEFKSRDKLVPIEKRLLQHSGFIAIDVDKKDNPRLRTSDLIDKDCVAQFLSAGGEGLKIIYKCTETKDPATHRRIFDAVVDRLDKKGVKINIDPIVKSIASLQYVSYDPKAFIRMDSKLVIKPLPKKERKAKRISTTIEKDLIQLNEYIDNIGDKDITADYENWMLLMFGISHSLGEAGREAMHRLSQNYEDYSREETDLFFDSCLERDTSSIENPVTIATVFQIINDNLPKLTLKNLLKKFTKSHAVGKGEDAKEGDTLNGDLAGMVRYKLFLFKKIIDKENNTLLELVPNTVNLNAFEELLKSKGFYRFEARYVYIKDNIVEAVDLPDIVRMVTTHIDGDGDYQFSYRGQEWFIGWEELAYLWRKIRGSSSIYNQISASLTHWVPDLLKDTHDTSFVPYQNGVVKVTAKGISMMPYSELKQQIWKERILPREFKQDKTAGMFEDFFINVHGRGKTRKERLNSENYKRAVWYYGYMLQGSKRQSTARAWLLYDIRSGNNGRSGKTILGNAVAQIRSTIVIDGKRTDISERFAFQTIKPWTDVIFIDDPKKGTSITSLFNIITGNISADRKNIEPVEKAVKVIIASNWIMEAEGTSEQGRQFVSQVEDFYIKYAREHDTITPIVDVHGKEFFTDWNEKDYNKFDTFSMHALHAHLRESAPGNTVMGNSLQIRFIQLHEEELFYELAEAFKKHAQDTKEGSTIVCNILTNIIKDDGEGARNEKTGRTARMFLRAIGADSIDLTSVRAGSQIRKAYRINKKIQDCILKMP